MGLLGVLAVAVVAALALGSGSGGSHGRSTPTGRVGARPARAAVGTLELRTAGRTVARISLRPYLRAGSQSLDQRTLTRAVEAAVLATAWQRSGTSSVLYRNDRAGVLRAVAGLSAAGGVVEVRRRALASRIAAPVIAQTLRNDCEATALQSLLATRGALVPQLRLQAELPRSGPLDPIGAGAQRVWGDPESGFVGRPDGGGESGGFGVYQRPIQSLAARHGQQLVDLTRAAPARLYQQLLLGHAVMAWIGLSDGPYAQWHSPAGRLVRVDYGEHAVVLDGIDADGAVRVMNPLEGTQETWSRARFESAWGLLGRRALGA
ncbi:MAG: hypothetical protein JWQ48_2284 [Conexibacter sp.]|nr:hypothetical protein [Conexibacter sp.]